jgi:hypothetical protein
MTNEYVDLDTEMGQVSLTVQRDEDDPKNGKVWLILRAKVGRKQVFRKVLKLSPDVFANLADLINVAAVEPGRKIIERTVQR